MAFAHRPKLVGASQELLRKIIQTLVQSDDSLCFEPHSLHLHKRLTAFVRIIDYPHPERVQNVLALDIRSFVRTVQVHGNGKRIFVNCVDVADQAIDFRDKASLEAGEPWRFQGLHALCSRANTGACKTVDVILALRVPCHFRQQFRFCRRFHLVFRRKAATVPHVKTRRVHIHFQKELAFRLATAFNATFACNLRTEISQKRLGVEILATLIDFVKDAQERRCRERELFQFIFCRNRLVFFKDDATIFQRIHERRPEIPHRIANREYHARRIDAFAHRTAKRNDGLFRVNSIYPFFLPSLDGL